VLNPWNLDGLRDMQQATGRRVACVLQLRLHPALLAFRESLRADSAARRTVDLVYVTPRGRWYLASWKGEEARSGGIATNIGIHLFDLLMWLFGGVEESRVALREPMRAAGSLRLERADVRWYLSADGADCERFGRPRAAYRALSVDGQELEFSDGFTDLHTETYRHVLSGQGFGIDDVLPSIQLAHDIRHAVPDAAALPSGWPFLP